MSNPRFASIHGATILVTLTLAVAACSAAGPGTSGAPESAGPSGRPEISLGPLPTVPASSAPVTGEVPDAVMAAVRADLSGKTGKDATAATVTTAEAVEWPDGSLGCPEPGMMYTQMVQPGYHVVLELDGTSYDYRVAGEGTMIHFCENPKPAGA